MSDDQGAPANFGGRVLSNEAGVKPSWDTEGPKPDEPTAGAHFSIDNPPAADLGQHKPHPIMQHFSKKPQKPAGKPVTATDN